MTFEDLKTNCLEIREKSKENSMAYAHAAAKIAEEVVGIYMRSLFARNQDFGVMRFWFSGFPNDLLKIEVAYWDKNTATCCWQREETTGVDFVPTSPWNIKDAWSGFVYILRADGYHVMVSEGKCVIQISKEMMES